MEKARKKRLEEFIEPFRVPPETKVSLARDYDPGFKHGIDEKEDGVALLEEGVELLASYQARLAAQDTWGVLVILQALDAAGKDGTIRHVMSGVNPQGVVVHSFKVPSQEARSAATCGSVDTGRSMTGSATSSITASGS